MWGSGFAVRMSSFLLRVAAGLAMLVLGSTAAQAQTYTFSYTGSIASWTVPATGTYHITAIGAAGKANGSGRTGGRGAELSGDFNLTAGATYKIAVGGEGSTDSHNGGGGGGTFFVDSSDAPILIAGGGGGTREGAGQNGTDANTGEFGMTGSTNHSTYTPAAKTGSLGLGGNNGGPSRYGSGGAGFFGNGVDDVGVGSGGRDWANGMTGGTGTAHGGFGGGGAGNGGYGGGGGGGYSGGDGGWIAGGGGSYNTGANPTALAGIGTGNGSLTIVLASASDTGATAAIGDFLVTREHLLLSTLPGADSRIGRFSGGSSSGNVGISGLGYVDTSLPFNIQFSPSQVHVTYDSTSLAAAYATARMAAGTQSDNDLSNGQLLDYAPSLQVQNAGTPSAPDVAASKPVARLAFWADGTGAKGSDGSIFGVMHVGADYLVTEQLLLGIDVSLDAMQQATASSSLKGLGYLAGPYATVKLNDNLYLDAHVAGGQSFNSITIGGGTSQFASTRWLATGAVIGKFDAGAVHVSPEARVSAIDDRSAAYTDALGNAAPSVDAATGQAEFGPRLSVDLKGDGATWSPYVEAHGVWTFLNTDTGGSTAPGTGLSANLGLGVTMAAGSASASAGAFYDGLGSGWGAWGASVGLHGAM
jgi:hypothetical protein